MIGALAGFLVAVVARQPAHQHHDQKDDRKHQQADPQRFAIRRSVHHFFQGLVVLFRARLCLLKAAADTPIISRVWISKAIGQAAIVRKARVRELALQLAAFFTSARVFGAREARAQPALLGRWPMLEAFAKPRWIALFRPWQRMVWGVLDRLRQRTLARGRLPSFFAAKIVCHLRRLLLRAARRPRLSFELFTAGRFARFFINLFAVIHGRVLLQQRIDGRHQKQRANRRED